MHTTKTTTLNLQSMSHVELERLLRGEIECAPAFAPATGAYSERVDDIDIIVCGRVDFLDACRLVESPFQLGYMAGSFANRESNAIAHQRPWV